MKFTAVIIVSVLSVSCGSGTDPVRQEPSSGGAAGQSTGGAPSGGTSAIAGSAGRSVASGGSSGSRSDLPCERLDLQDGETGPYGVTLIYSRNGDSFSFGTLGVSEGFVYVTDEGRLKRVPVTGGAVEELGPISRRGSLTSTGQIVWTEQGSDDSRRVLIAALTSPSSPNVLAESIPMIYSQTFDADAAYFETRKPSAIWRVPFDASGATQLVSDVSVTGMVSHNGHLYWLDPSTERLMRVPTGGGAPEKLVEIFHGGSMAADGDAVYWADHSLGTVEKWAPGATTSQVLRDVQGQLLKPQNIRALNGRVYWTETGPCSSLHRAEADGSEHTVLLPPGDIGGLVGHTDKHLIVADLQKIYRIER